MDRPRLEDGPAGGPVETERRSVTDRSALERPTLSRGHDNVAVAEVDCRGLRLAEAARTRDDRVKHRLDGGRRTADDAEYL